MTPAVVLLLAVAPADFPRFEPQELASDLGIGYAVLTPDLNGDQKPDILVVDKHRVLWFENPTWERRTILQGKTAPDNVCAATADVDGDGKLDVVLGAGWKPTDTRTPGTLQWLRRGRSLDDEWELFPIPCDEPTVHRIRVIDQHLIVAPLQGRDCTAKGNWVDGRPVRILRYPLPADPTKPVAWEPEVVSEEFFTVHNFAVAGNGLLIGNGRGLARRLGRPGAIEHLTDALYPGCRGASEVALSGGLVATVEPWHGNQVVVYPHVATRKVLDDKLRWGHAIKLADLDGDGSAEVIAGIRDDPGKGDPFPDRRGVRVYRSADGWKTFTRHLIDPGGVAVEDVAVEDLDGDRRPDLIAVGRQTKNLKVYWNRRP
jgi:hypothetical protein